MYGLITHAESGQADRFSATCLTESPGLSAYPHRLNSTVNDVGFQLKSFAAFDR